MQTKMTMNSEQYENLIALMKEALKFYANKENYLFYKDRDAPIALDEGSQARFALKQVNETLEENQKMMNDYNKVITETIDAIENHPFDIRNIKAEIDALNNIGNEGHD